MFCCCKLISILKTLLDIKQFMLTPTDNYFIHRHTNMIDTQTESYDVVGIMDKIETTR